MEIAYFFKGILIGFSIAAPVGPIGILTIQRSLNHGAFAGLATGMGAASADAIYGCLAAFGLTFASGFLLAWNPWILKAGGLFLLAMGLAFLFRAPGPRPAAQSPFSSCPGAYFSALFLTLTNPMTIMAFAAIFAGLGLGLARESYLSAGILVSGVFFGSSLWWFFLAFGTGAFRGRVGDRFMLWLNRGAGGILLGFGLWSLCASPA